MRDSALLPHTSVALWSATRDVVALPPCPRVTEMPSLRARLRYVVGAYLGCLVALSPLLLFLTLRNFAPLAVALSAIGTMLLARRADEREALAELLDADFLARWERVTSVARARSVPAGLQEALERVSREGAHLARLQRMTGMCSRRGLQDLVRDVRVLHQRLQRHHRGRN
ncbi:MAG: hypothetical protein AB2A00_20825 [Myxococcota bacterium]